MYREITARTGPDIMHYYPCDMRFLGKFNRMSMNGFALPDKAFNVIVKEAADKIKHFKKYQP